MATLTGQLARYTLAGVDNPYLIPAHNEFAPLGVPYESDAQPYLAGGVLVRQTPVQANGHAIAGGRQGSYAHDYYYRVHVDPPEAHLGNIVSTQTNTVSVWNANFEPRVLVDITGLGEGIEISGQPEPPLTLPALKELQWQLTVEPDGIPTIDIVLRWLFSEEAPGIRVTANRIVPWSFVPDWEEPVIERLTAATDVLQSESGVSQRRQLRLTPRRELEASLYVEGRERKLLEMALVGWSGRVWALPIWPDVQFLQSHVETGATWIACQTQNLDFRVGGLVLLRGESALLTEALEVLAIETEGLQFRRPVQRDWPIGTRLYPARSARLTVQPVMTKLSDECAQADVSFLITEACEWAAKMPTALYRGRPVWARKPDDSEDLTNSFERLQLTLDNGMAAPGSMDTAGRAFGVLGQRWIDKGRAERAALKSFIYAMCGRQKAVWVPTHMSDLELVAPISSVGTTMDVAWLGYTRFSGTAPTRRDFRIELHDGRVFVRRVVSSAVISDDVERLAFEGQLGTLIEPSAVRRISWMLLCRFASDTQEIHHHTDSEGVATWKTTFREERDDEF